MSVNQDEVEKGGVRFFVIDDDPDHRLLAETIIQAVGKGKPTIFSTAKEALDYFLDEETFISGSQHVIFLDLMLPDVSGLEVIISLRKDRRWRSSFLAVLTSLNCPIERQKCFEFGADIFISKPISTTSVREILSMLD